MTLASLSTGEVYALAAAVVCLCVAAAAFFYKQSQEAKYQNKSQGTHPLVVWSVVCFLFTAMIWLPYVLGVVPERLTPTLLLLTGCAWAVFAFIIFRNFVRLKPKSIMHIHKKVVLPMLLEEFGARPYAGRGTTWPIAWMKRSIEKANGVMNVVDTFLLDLTTDYSMTKFFLIQYDAIEKSFINVHPDPPAAQTARLLEKNPGELSNQDLRRHIDEIQRETANEFAQRSGVQD